ncbi:UrcA family protein [Sphingomonas naphthae]|uniref:UrcA family protein n=1 Tax=Sphingomonas naphthae TaxID=1813468 RepID=A0ABY7TNR1_9SPHN|nr:UrcA family protein [Sphingomonas naphthae]WCT74565.1 UrcA family protein [Sphingomonas naphthae]
MFKTILVPLIAAPLFAAAAAPAFAATPVTEPTAVRVATADLDLASAAGKKTLAKRISSAVNAVCQAPTDYRDLTALQHSMDCKVRAETAAQVHLASILELRETQLAEAGSPAHGG